VELEDEELFVVLLLLLDFFCLLLVEDDVDNGAGAESGSIGRFDDLDD
jgi:hypothetical protein